MQQYVGRFAPSPTGPLHFGSLLTAVASYLDAKSNDGLWLVRIEDLDPPREIPGATANILSTLESYHLHWDQDVVYQSQRHKHYDAAIQQLLSRGKAFYCTCTRKQLSQQSEQSGTAYPGNCRGCSQEPSAPHSIRLQVNAKPVTIQDDLQGLYQQNIEQYVGDFIIRRKDRLYAYHIAVVVDDHEQKISHIVRGIDLLDNTPRQQYLQHQLGFLAPQYCHLPIVVNSQGQKLSKQTFATPVPSTQCNLYLWHALTALGLAPAPELKLETTETQLAWGISVWNKDKLKGLKSIPSTSVAIDV